MKVEKKFTAPTYTVEFTQEEYKDLVCILGNIPLGVLASNMASQGVQNPPGMAGKVHVFWHNLKSNL